MMEVASARPSRSSTSTTSSHPEAAAWYAGAGMRPPGNLVVDGNPPLPVPLTLHHGRVHDGDWDAVCVERAADCATVLACETRHAQMGMAGPDVRIGEGGSCPAAAVVLGLSVSLYRRLLLR